MDRQGLATTDPTALTGRGPDLRLLIEFLTAPAAVRQGRVVSGGVLVLRGSAGIGKSALLDVVSAQAVASGTLVLRATAIASEVDIGFAALSQLLGHALPLLPRLSRRERSVLSAALTHADTGARSIVEIADAVTALLRACAATETAGMPPFGPALVIVDDAQWVDRASAAVLRSVVPTLRSSPVRVLLAERAGSHTFLDTAAHRQHQLLPLTDEAAELLLRRQVPASSPTVRARIIREAGGHPL